MSFLGEYAGALIAAGSIIAVALLGMVGTLVAKRMREPTRIETLWERLDQQDVRIKALEDRADVAERRDRAKGRVIRALARQWTGPTPHLDPLDLIEIDEDTLASHHPWRVKP